MIFEVQVNRLNSQRTFATSMSSCSSSEAVDYGCRVYIPMNKVPALEKVARMSFYGAPTLAAAAASQCWSAANMYHVIFLSVVMLRNVT